MGNRRVIGLILNTAMSGVSKPASTVAPAILTTAVIGTEIAGDDGTWLPTADSYTYQWQRVTSDIAGATNKNYTPVDADFGYALRLEVTATNAAGSTVAYSNATNLVIEAPVQTVGLTELVTDGGFENWTSPTNLASWTETIAGTSSVNQEGTEKYAGSYAVKLTSDASNSLVIISQGISVAAGVYLDLNFYAKSNPSGRALRSDIGAVALSTTLLGDYTNCRAIGRAAALNPPAQIFRVTASTSYYVDAYSIKTLTPNGQLTAPSANMRLDASYTLPASPGIGSQVWILLRISDFAAGNYWRAVPVYSGSQWDINLYSVASHTATSRISATNVGATDHTRVNMKDDAISLFTSADDGENYTQRGSTITNNTYQTATGVNALWTSDVTPDQLVYAAAV